MSIPVSIGRYEPLHAIASGGMATVYLARARGARGFERHVALKVMHPHLAEDQQFVEMFLDEARMAANIRHPNVVSTLDVVEEEGQLFLVMEYVEGASLQAVIRAMTKRRTMLPIDHTVRILLDVLAGLHAAHEQTMPNGLPMNMVHRDISPHNVLVGIDGVARIMDFGVARAEVRINSTIGANPKGKLPYMAPEQISSKPLDRRADIYAAAIVLWELLTGKGLFRADNEGALLHLALKGATRSPTEVNPDVPQAISAVCMRGLALNAEDRFATAADFAEALEAAAKEAQLAIAAPRTIGAFIKDLVPNVASTASGTDSGMPRSLRTPAPSSLRSGPVTGGTPVPSSVSTSSVMPQMADGSTPGSSRIDGPNIGNTGPTPISMPSPMTADSQSLSASRSRSRMIVAAACAVTLLMSLVVWFLVHNSGAAPTTAQQETAPETSSGIAQPQPTPTVEPMGMPVASSLTSAQAAAPASSAKGAEKATTKTTKVPTNRVKTPPNRPGSPTFRPEEP